MGKYTKEQVQKVMKEKCFIGKSNIELAVAGAMKINKGLLLNLNGVTVATMEWMYPEDGGQEGMIYVNLSADDKYEFFFKKNEGNDMVTYQLATDLVVEKLLNTLHEEYGRDVGLQFVMHYEVGTLLVIPEEDKVSKEEFDEVFKRIVGFQSMYLSQRMQLFENAKDKNNNLVSKSFGTDFTSELKVFNIPLWVDVVDGVDVFRSHKTRAMENIIKDVESKMLTMEAQHDKHPNSIMPFATLVYPTTLYKIPIDHKRSTVIRGVAEWKYLPAMTFEFLGIKTLSELVDKYLY